MGNHSDRCWTHMYCIHAILNYSEVFGEKTREDMVLHQLKRQINHNHIVIKY